MIQMCCGLYCAQRWKMPEPKVSPTPSTADSQTNPPVPAEPFDFEEWMNEAVGAMVESLNKQAKKS
jgi:hypothetical protein